MDKKRKKKKRDVVSVRFAYSRIFLFVILFD